MNAVIHAQASMKAINSKDDKDFQFFLKLHDFMDCSKELESSNLHRFLTHHLFFVKRVVIPIFGHNYVAASGRNVNIKDSMEQEHILLDFRNKFLPSLSDYVVLIKDDSSDEQTFKSFQDENKEFFESNPEIQELMLAPLANTGMVKSLWLTHNSWFIGEILPKIYKNIKIKIKNYDKFSPSIPFNRMRFEGWIQNGLDFPPSSVKIKEYRDNRVKKALELR